MHEPNLINVPVWVNAIEKSRPPANSQQLEICFSVNKGVSESSEVNVISKICFGVSI